MQVQALSSLQIKTGKESTAIEPHLLRLGGAYLEFSTPNSAGKFDASMRPAHWFIKVNLEDKKLKLDWIDDDDFKKAVQSGTVHLPNELLGEGDHKNVVITASTCELQKFMIDHADDELLFNSKSQGLHRKE